MNFLKSIKINIQSVKTIIIGNSAAFFGLIAIAIGYSLFSMNQIGTELKSITEKDIPLTQNLTDITMLHIKQAVEFERAFRFGEQLQQGKKAEALFAEQVAEFDTHGVTIDQTIEHVEVLLEKTINEAHSEVEVKKFSHFDEIIKVIKQKHNNYVIHADEVFTLLSGRKLHEAELLMEKVEVEEHQLETTMESLFTEIEKFTNVATKTAEKHEQNAVRMLSIISVVALLLGFGLTRQMIKSISNPFVPFIDTVNKLIGGDNMARVGLKSANEFGQLSTAFDKMLDDRIEGLAKMADCVGQIEAIGKAQAVIEFNMDGTVIMANELFTDTMDYRLDEIKGQHHSMFVESGFKESVEYRQFWEKLNRGEYEDGEYKRIGKGGKEVWLWASYNPILDMDGKPFKVVKYASDITKQKLENANTSGQIKAIGKSQAVIEFNMDGTIIIANDLFTGTVGYSLDEIKGQHHSMFAEPEFAKSVEYRQFWEKLNRGEYDSGEYKRIGKGGKEIWLQASYNPIMDLNGKPFKVVKYATDITEQKLANTENQLIKTALDQVSSNVMMADEDLNIIYMNGTATEMFSNNETNLKKDLPNFRANKLIGTNIDVFHKNPAHQRGILERLTETLKTELDVGGLSMRIVASPVNDENGNRLGTVVEWTDRTEEKAQMEREARMNADNMRIKTALDQVASNVMMADKDLNIIYMNNTAKDLFSRNEADFKTDLPNFNASKLIGTNIDVFHKNPAHQRGILNNLTQTIEAELNIGNRIMKAIASPVNDENGNRLGTVVEWVDRTEEKARLESEAKEAAANGRVKTALDQVNSNVMMADADLNIIYMNKSATQLFNRNETDFRKDLPNFEAKQLVGSNIDIFHKNPAHQRGILQNLTQTIESELELGGRSMQFVASPVNDDSGQRLGTVVEWIDRTDQEATEQEVNSIVQAASSGNFSERIEETGKEGFFERLAIGINQVMQTTDTSLNDVVRVLQSLSQGDLTHSIEADYQGLFGQLKADLNTTVSKLSDVLGNVNSSVSFIANSSEEVSSTAQSLAQGASEQAASVEETSASIEQMSASINQNNENAKVTNDIASQSATQAVDGGEAVKETVSAMNQIASKIGIIEDIAYQTNILALNAAIEAARAGEHGKGFAVVAAEVRKLAERSQISATEISELASTSVTIAEQAGKLLEEIVPGINKTAGLVQEISAASDEQASGATQITNAMSQLDQVTQQTASASEELTATSEGMRNQSRSLLQQIGFFKLDENDEQVSDQRGPDRPFSSPAKDTAKFVVDNHPDDAIDESHFSKFS